MAACKIAPLMMTSTTLSNKLDRQIEDPAQYTLIHKYVESGHFEKALSLFDSMQAESAYLDQSSLQALLKACARLTCLETGHRIHTEMTKRAYHGSLIVASSLLDMYAKNGALFEAQYVFEEMPIKDAVLWASLVAGYTEHGLAEEALNCLQKMQSEGFHPTPSTFVCSLKACSIIKAIRKGQDLHKEIVKDGLEGSLFVGNALVNMYAKCGMVVEAQEVFDEMPIHDVVSWTTLIIGYAEGGSGDKALTCFEQMQQQADVLPNVVTFVCILKSCSAVRAVGFGQEIYAEVVKEGYETDAAIGNTTVDLYAKAGYFTEARDVFDSVPIRSRVTWNALIGGYSEHGLGHEALACLQEMKEEDLLPNQVTYVCCLKACGDMGAMGRGQQLHDEVLGEGFEREEIVGSTLVDMYAKCGALDEATDVFSELAAKDVVSWTALLAGFASQGASEAVHDLLDRMRQEGVYPNDVTCLGVLTVCNHMGFIREGQEFVRVCVMEYGIKLTIEHYNCMIDALSRAGRIMEAVALVGTLPFQPDHMSFYSILSACHRWREAELSRQVADAVAFQRKHSSLLVLLSNLYADAGD